MSMEHRPRGSRLDLWEWIYSKQLLRWGKRSSLAARLALQQLRQNPEKLIDLGCGYGRDLAYFRKHLGSSTLRGVDWSKSAIDLYNSYFGEQEREAVKRFDLLKKQWPAWMKGCDVAYSNYLFHLLTLEECRKILQRLRTCMTAKGTLISSFVCVSDRHYGKGHKIAENRYEVYRRLPWLFFDRAMIEEICIEAGFEIISLNSYRELEFVCGKPDVVNAVLLIARCSHSESKSKSIVRLSP